MTTLNDFLSGYFLWKDALLAACIVAFLCGWLGVYIVLKRIVFVSLALPQASGLGIACAFYIGSFFGIHGHLESWLLEPLVMAIIFSCAVAALFSFDFESRRISVEVTIGIAYILSSALLLQILNSPRIVQEVHEIGDILFGNAVVIQGSVLHALVITFVLILTIHVLGFKEIVAVLFDREMAQATGLKVKWINLVFFLTVAVSVSVATRAIGALPVFGFMVLPPTAALLMTKTLKKTIFVSVSIGIISAILGYFFSYIWALPTGATMCAVGALFIPLGLIIRR